MVYGGATVKRVSLSIPRSAVDRCTAECSRFFLMIAAPLTFLALKSDRSALLFDMESYCCAVVKCCQEIRSDYGAGSVRGVWIPMSPASSAASLLPSDEFPDLVYRDRKESSACNSTFG